MKRHFVVLMAVMGVAAMAIQTAHSMRKTNPAISQSIPPAVCNRTLGKRQPAPLLSSVQQSAVGRRASNLREALSRVHIVGSSRPSFPSGLVDAILEWQADYANDVMIWWDADTQTPFCIKGTDLTLAVASQQAKRALSPSASAALGTLERIAGLVGIQAPSEELRIVSERTDALGTTHIRFQQTYRGFDVWARHLAVHFNKSGRISAIEGRWAQTPVSLGKASAVVSSQEAKEFTLAWYQSAREVHADSIWTTVYVDRNHAPHLAWAVRISIGQTEAYDVFVDAETMEFLHESPLICSDGPVVGSGTDLSGTTRTVYAYLEGSTYYMWNTTKPMTGVIAIYNYGSTAHALVQSASALSWGNPAAVTASHNLGIVYDYFLSKHGRNSIDGSGGTLRAVVNDFETTNNASFNHGSQTMKFGSGDGAMFSNLAGALDVTGHEMGHGVINSTSGLKYEFQSGALNESFADVFGTMTEFYHLGGGRRLAPW